MTSLFGINNCDTVKKACQWLDENNINYTFHDFRKDGLTHNILNDWADTIGWEILLNRRSTTWRQLGEHDKLDINQEKAIKLMNDNVTLIKRPLLQTNKKIIVGFDKLIYQQLFME